MGVKGMKYVVCALPMLFGNEVLSWICLAVLAVVFVCDLTLKIEREKDSR